MLDDLEDRLSNLDGLVAEIASELIANEVVHDLPGGEWRRIQRAEGYRVVVVNGQQTIADDGETNVHAGRLLRHGKG